MKIEKLNEDKIRITLNIEDLKSKNIDFHSFMSNPIENQSLFIEMLDVAEKEVGFKTENYRISIEAIAMSNGSFIFTVTRIMEQNLQDKKQVHIKRKETKSNFLIYEFMEFEDFCEFCKCYDKSVIREEKELSKNNSLYMYNEKYYLVVKVLNIESKVLKIFNSMIIEFARTVQKSSLAEGKLKEYGKIIMKTNALKTALKYF